MIRAEWSGVAVSDNDRVRPGRGRLVANPAYKAFKDSMAWRIRVDKGPWTFTTNRVAVRLQAWLPPRMDVTAIVKAALDAVQLAGVVANDNQVDRLTVERMGPAAGRESRIIFEIEEVANGHE